MGQLRSRLFALCHILAVSLFPRVADASIQLASKAVSGPSATANGSSTGGAMSADGRFSVYTSSATNLVSGQTGVDQQVFLYDRALGTNSLVSHQVGNPSAGAPGGSFQPIISGDGNWVVFRSLGANLVTGFTPTTPQLFLYERTTGTVTLISHYPGLPLTEALLPFPPTSMSFDGRYIPFRATDSFGFNDTNGLFPDVFLYDRVTDTLQLVSHSSASLTATSVDASSVDQIVSDWTAVISADGSTVAFTSDGTDYVSGAVDTNNTNDLFLWDRLTGQITLATHAPSQPLVAASSSFVGMVGESAPPYLSANGSFVAYFAFFESLVEGQGQAPFGAVYLYDRSLNANTIVTHAIGAPTTPLLFATSEATGISADGRYVAFSSDDDAVVSGVTDVNGVSDVFRYDRLTDTSVLVSHAVSGPSVSGNGESIGGNMSSDGSRMTFNSKATNLGFTDTNGGYDVILWIDTGVLHLASHAAGDPSTAANGPSSGGLCADGSVVAFTASPTNNNVVANDLNSAGDVFLFSFSTPPTVQNPAATGIGTTAATLNADVTSDGGLLVFQRGFVWSPTSVDADPQLGDAGVTATLVSGGLGSMSALLAGLSPATDYSFRAFATNGIGAAYSSLATFTTANSCPAINLAGLPHGIVGQAYAGATTATGGVGPYSYTVTVGSLPSGLTLTMAGVGAGAVTGTPTVTGAFAFQISAADANACVGIANYVLVIGSAVSPGDLVIREFRWRGPAGEQDEYVEVHNKTSGPITVAAVDGSSGFGIAAELSGLLATIPNGTVIPARGAFLAANSTPITGYSLSSYGGVGAANHDASWTTDVADSSGVGLFRSSTALTLEARLDAAGFANSLAPYVEGTGLSPSGGIGALAEFAFVRKTSFPSVTTQDTGNNAADFLFVAPDAALYSGAQSALGSPGPQNLPSAPQRGLVFTHPNPSVSQTTYPNRHRIGTTYHFRWKITNNTGAPINTLRLRVLELTTIQGPGYANPTQAAFRLVTSSGTHTFSTLTDGVQTAINTVLEEPPAQMVGGGFNSTVSVPLGSVIPAGGFVYVNVAMSFASPGRGGSYRYYVAAEAK